MRPIPLTIPTYYDPGFAAPIGDHIMPIRKFGLVAEEAREIDGVRLLSPAPCHRSQLLRVHTPNYIDAIQSGHPRTLAESQKFPWSPELYPSVCLTNGAVIAAAATAMKDGIAAAIASGFHHAHADHGEGFCVIHDVAIVLSLLKDNNTKRHVRINCHASNQAVPTSRVAV